MDERTQAMLSRVRVAAMQTERKPSRAQITAGNYSKGRFWWNGHEISIENPRGSIRSGVSKSGKAWAVRMPCHYGYIRRTISKADGDAVDVMIGPNPASDLVCVVDQQNSGGRFDEHKAVLGCNSLAEAKKLYLSCYSSGWTGLRSITAMTRQQFLAWLERGDTAKPIEGQVSRYEKSAASVEDQPRDKNGQWVATGGGSSASSRPSKSTRKKHRDNYRKTTSDSTERYSIDPDTIISDLKERGLPSTAWIAAPLSRHLDAIDKALSGDQIELGASHAKRAMDLLQRAYDETKAHNDAREEKNHETIDVDLDEMKRGIESLRDVVELKRYLNDQKFGTALKSAGFSRGIKPGTGNNKTQVGWEKDGEFYTVLQAVQMLNTGKKTLYAKGDNMQEKYDRTALAAARYAAVEAGERWITINGGSKEDGEGGGTPVKIDGHGNITAGPKGIADKGIKKLSDFGKKKGEGKSESPSSAPASSPSESPASPAASSPAASSPSASPKYFARGNTIFDANGVRHGAFRNDEKARDAAERWNVEGKPGEQKPTPTTPENKPPEKHETFAGGVATTPEGNREQVRQQVIKDFNETGTYKGGRLHEGYLVSKDAKKAALAAGYTAEQFADEYLQHNGDQLDKSWADNIAYLPNRKIDVPPEVMERAKAILGDTGKASEKPAPKTYHDHAKDVEDQLADKGLEIGRDKTGKWTAFRNGDDDKGPYQDHIGQSFDSYDDAADAALKHDWDAGKEKKPRTLKDVQDEHYEANKAMKAAGKALLDAAGLYKKNDMDVATKKTTIGAAMEFTSHTIDTALKSTKVPRELKDAYREARDRVKQLEAEGDELADTTKPADTGEGWDAEHLRGNPQMMTPAQRAARDAYIEENERADEAHREKVRQAEAAKVTPATNEFTRPTRQAFEKAQLSAKDAVAQGIISKGSDGKWYGSSGNRQFDTAEAAINAYHDNLKRIDDAETEAKIKAHGESPVKAVRDGDSVEVTYPNGQSETMTMRDYRRKVFDIEDKHGNVSLVNKSELGGEGSFRERHQSHMASGKNDFNATLHALSDHLKSKGVDVSPGELNSRWSNHYVGSINKNSTEDQIKAAFESSRDDKPTTDEWWMSQSPTLGFHGSIQKKDEEIEKRRANLLEHADGLESDAKILKALGSDKADSLTAKANHIRKQVESNRQAYKTAIEQEKKADDERQATEAEQRRWKPEPNGAKPLTPVQMASSNNNNSRYNFAKMLQETGWYSDSAFAIKPPEKIKDQILTKSHGTSAAGRYPDIAKMANEAGRANTPAMKPLGERTKVYEKTKKNSESTQHQTVMADDEGHHVVLDSKYVRTIQKMHPQATFHATSEGGPVAVKSGGEVVGLLMPLGGDRDHETEAHVKQATGAKKVTRYSRTDFAAMRHNMRYGRAATTSR